MRLIALLVIPLAFAVALAGCSSAPKQSTNDGSGDSIDTNINVTNGTSNSSTTSNNTVGAGGNATSGGP